MNTKRQGSLGVARAVWYYTEKGCAVFTPVSDVSRYDLIVDDGQRLLKVEVKTTRQKNGQVGLRTHGGNQSWSGECKRISASDCDIVFAVNLNSGTVREFQASDLAGRNSVTVR